jgi:hypothetical protein
MAEIVRTYEGIQSVKDDKIVDLHIYSDGHTREVDQVNKTLVSRTNPTESYADVASGKTVKANKINVRVDTLLTAMKITKDHPEYEIAVQLARTWVSSERSDAGIRSYRELIDRFGGKQDVKEVDQYCIEYKGELYQNWKRLTEVVVGSDIPAIFAHNEKVDHE